MADTIGNRYLVVLFLDGGNDGLNTVVPYGSGALRDRLQRLPRTGGGGINLTQARARRHRHRQRPAAPARSSRSIPGFDRPASSSTTSARSRSIQGCGYPDYSLSHEESRGIWQTGNPTGTRRYGGTGWVGRHLAGELRRQPTCPASASPATSRREFRQTAHERARDRPPRATSASPTTTSATATSSRASATAFQRSTPQAAGEAQPIRSYVGDTGGATLLSSESYPARARRSTRPTGRQRRTTPTTTSTAARRATCARSRRSSTRVEHAALPNVNAHFFQLSNGGYDTHSDQGAGEPDGQHYDLHREVGDSLKVFYDDLVDMGVASRVCIVVWSEFSRRIPQNDNGTDHGSQGPMFVIGGAVNGGVYGNHPNITQTLDDDENTVYSQAAATRTARPTSATSTARSSSTGSTCRRRTSWRTCLPLDAGDPAELLDGRRTSTWASCRSHSPTTTSATRASCSSPSST